MLTTPIGIITLVKFHNNMDVDSPNKIITRTLGKFGVVDNDWKKEVHPSTEEEPKGEEFWLVKIIKDIRPGQSQGCFVLRPIRKVDYSSTGKLVTGMYTHIDIGNICVIVPNMEFRNKVWQLPLDARKNNKSKAIVVAQFVEKGEGKLYAD